MTGVRWGRLAAMLAAAAFSAVGCCDKEKKEILALNGKVSDLETQNNDYRMQLLQAQARQADLMSQLESKDAELGAAGARMKTLEAKPTVAPGPAPAPAAPGARDWEKGLVGDRITVGGDILFSSGRATLTPAGQSALDKIVADIKSKYPGLPVRVYGHTDKDPIEKTKNLWQDNLDLSANRAMAVTRYLVGKGVKATTIETVAMGEHYPAPTKADSRRVEIVVIKK